MKNSKNLFHRSFAGVGSLKFASRPLRLAAALLLLVTTMNAMSAEMVRYRPKPNANKVRIDGKANIHNWFMEGAIISGFLDIPEGITLDSAKADISGLTGDKLEAHCEIGIPLSSITSSTPHTDGMNDVMLQTMHADAYPRIIFRLGELTLKKPHAAGTPFEFTAKGDLEVSGVTNKITFPVKIESQEDSKLKVSGTDIPLKMTDFKLVPPVKLGIFKSEDEILISFTSVVGKSLKK